MSPDCSASRSRRVLFLCTGNYYRSRFAEAVFNHHAATRRLPWIATSRGLATHLQEGDLSPLTAQALAERQIELTHTGPTRQAVCVTDFEGADLVIAMEDREHRPYVRSRFPEWENRTLFWDVSDIDFTPWEEALPAVERHVLRLIEELEAEADGRTDA
jgi:protein-tyrosine phosphatase